jgi:ABC-type multidrug transport system ATPase subunit
MLFDEPTSGLDPMTSKHVMDLVIRARDAHDISSLYVTKELHEIPYLANHYVASSDAGRVEIVEGKDLGAGTMRVLLLERGEVAFIGTPGEFAASALPAVTSMTRPDVGRVTTLHRLRRARPQETVREASEVLRA